MGRVRRRGALIEILPSSGLAGGERRAPWARAPRVGSARESLSLRATQGAPSSSGPQYARSKRAQRRFNSRRPGHPMHSMTQSTKFTIRKFQADKKNPNRNLFFFFSSAEPLRFARRRPLADVHTHRLSACLCTSLGSPPKSARAISRREGEYLDPSSEDTRRI